MQGKLTEADGQTTDASLDEVRRRLGADAFFWLDLQGVDTEARDLLCQDFGFHPLAVEDAEHFGQRPKVDDFTGFTYLVVHGALAAAGELGHHRGPRLPHPPARGHREPGRRAPPRRGPGAARPAPCRGRLIPRVAVLYLVVDELVDGYFPVLAQLDDRIDRSRTRS